LKFKSQPLCSNADSEETKDDKNKRNKNIEMKRKGVEWGWCGVAK